jgi:pimeloyl-ACP methyl ester carboxylesterase
MTPFSLPISAATARRLSHAAGALALVALLSACGDSDPPRGALLSSAQVVPVTKSAIDAAMTTAGLAPLAGAAKCNVTVREIVYATPGPKGGMYDVSAALLIPTDCAAGVPSPMPLVAYNRGTEVVKSRAMANPSDAETGALMGLLAAQGYAVVATDYLGYHRSTHAYHPYLHAESQASTTVDSIRAARNALAAMGLSTSGKLLLTGYSQGGHASMATLKAIEADAGLGLTVAAAGPMSGPYSLTNSFVAGLTLLPQGSGGSSVFTPFLVSSYQKIYGNVYTTVTDFYKAPYATGIEDLLPGTRSFNELYTSGKLPVALGDLVTDAAVASIGNASSNIRKALLANDLTSGWTPKAPLMMCGGSGDPVVLYAQNTTVALAAFGGATPTRFAVDVNDAMVGAGIPAFSANYHGAALPFCLKAVRDGLFNSLFTPPA